MVKKTEVTHTTTATQPQQPATPATPAPATATTLGASKAEMTVMKLTVALRKERNVEVKPEMLSTDGKFLVLKIGDAWPQIRIGVGGGIDLPAIKSYPKAWDAALIGDQLLAKQTERAAKKSAPAPKQETPKTTPAAAPTAKDTPTQKKQKAAEQIEKKLEAAIA